MLAEAINFGLILIINMLTFFVVLINLANAILAINTAEDRTILLFLSH